MKNPVANAAGSVAGTATPVTPTTAQRDGGAGFKGNYDPDGIRLVLGWERTRWLRY